MSNSVCFNARVGADRYRLELLSLYPKLEHLRQASKRLAVVYRKDKAKLEAIKAVVDVFEKIWETLLEMVGILSNSFAPLPAESCDNANAKEYCTLWSSANQLILQEKVPQVRTVFEQALQALKTVHRDGQEDETVFGKEFVDNELPEPIRQLCRQTKQHEQQHSDLAKSFIYCIEVDGEDGPLSIQFPFALNRVIK